MFPLKIIHNAKNQENLFEWKKDNRCQPWDDTDAGIICSSHCKNASASIYELHRINEKIENLSKKIKILSKEIQDIKKNQMEILGKKNKKPITEIEKSMGGLNNKMD